MKKNTGKLQLVIQLFAGAVFILSNISSLEAINLPAAVLEMEQAIIAVTADAGKSVVSISTQKTSRVSSYMLGSRDDLFKEFFKDFFYGLTPNRDRLQLGLGSGVIIDQRGYILTNEHVISGAEIIKVTLADGSQYDAVLKGLDYRSNLAIIKIEADTLPFAQVGDSDTVRAGQWAIALGNPFGFATQIPTTPTVSFGVISALHRALPRTASRDRAYLDLFQTDASINPGNSGGPLLNIKGEVIGINVAIYSSSGKSDGIGFAIPINDAKIILDKLLKGEEIIYGWLGIEVQELNAVLANYFKLEKPEGVLILKVFQNSVAEKAGMENEDIIIKFNDKPINNTLDFLKEVSKAHAGDDLKVKIIRNGLPRTLRIKIGESPTSEELVVMTSLPPKQSIKTEDVPLAKLEEETILALTEKPWRGMNVVPINENFASMFNLENTLGVIVSEIKAGTQADRAGIKVNDIITQINTYKITSAQDFIKAISNIDGNALVKTSRGYLMLSE